MHQYLASVIFLLLCVSPVLAEECTVTMYGSLVTAAKSADVSRNWDKSADIYNRLLSECSSLINDADLLKTYDALAVAQMMTENYPVALENAKKCLELDSRYNSCMMTAARAYEMLGDRDMALNFARSAIEVGGYDDYSAAVVILAKDFLKKQGNPLQ